MCKNREGRVKSLAPFLPLTGTGVRVNFRRICKGGYLKQQIVGKRVPKTLYLQCFFWICLVKVLRNGFGMA